MVWDEERLKRVHIIFIGPSCRLQLGLAVIAEDQWVKDLRVKDKRAGLRVNTQRSLHECGGRPRLQRGLFM